MITSNMIGYELSSQSGKMVYAFDPKRMQSLSEGFVVATADEVDKAMQKAVVAWRIYRETDGERKAAFLRSIADQIEALDEILVARVMLETAYSEARVLTERRRTVAQLRMFADYVLQDDWKGILIDRSIPGRVPAPRPDLRKMNMAIGPVVVFAASNFPLAYSTMGGDAVSALAAGCPIIIKSHESHLGTNALVAEAVLKAAQETGMPDGVFSSLNGDGLQTGKLLVTHPLTAAVGFTGSLQGGRALFDLGQQRAIPIPVFSEMGSVNPVFLLPGKVVEDISALAGKLVDSMTLTVGQFCTNPGLIIALKNEHTAELISSLSYRLRDIAPEAMLNTNIAERYHQGVAAIRDIEPVQFVADPETTSNLQEAAPVLATVEASHFISHPLLHHEVFGPFSLFVLCTDFEEMKKVASSLEGQLTSTIHVTEEEASQAHALMGILVEKAGRIIFNGVPTGVEVCESMTHGGPYPASTDSRFTAVGHHAIRRWLRPVTFQDCPEFLLPADLKD